MHNTAKKLFLWAYTALLLSMSAVYAAEANRLNVLGVAYVTDFDMESGALPILPVSLPDGNYFRSVNLPKALTQERESWDGDTFRLIIRKSLDDADLDDVNDDGNEFAVELKINNPTNYAWTDGTANTKIVSGGGTASATLSAREVKPDENVTVGVSVQANTDMAGTCETRTTISFVMAGKPRYFYVHIILEPSA